MRDFLLMQKTVKFLRVLFALDFLRDSLYNKRCNMKIINLRKG